jgi:hypothetical protein
MMWKYIPFYLEVDCTSLNLIYNDEIFMKGDFFNDNHVTYVLFCVWTFVMNFVVFML